MGRMTDEQAEMEKLITSLCDDETREAYKAPYDHYRPALLPRVLGNTLVYLGNLVYGEKPSYLKFRAVEVIARVPYHSWTSAAFTLLTLFYADENRALKLSRIARYARFAADNETMHVVVVSALSRKEQRAGFFRYTLIPMFFAFFYFWLSYWIYLLHPKSALEINYLFEKHAFEQYSVFLKENEELLRNKPISSDFLAWYGRHTRSQYEFFEMVRNDELVHRNQSIHEINAHKGHGASD